MRKRCSAGFSVFLPAAVCLAFLVACSKNEQIVEEQRPLTPDFILLDLDGREFQLSKEQGKVVLLNFFSTTCLACQSEVPNLIALHNEHADEGLLVIGIALDVVGNGENVRNFAQQYEIPYRLLLDDGRVSLAYGVVQTVPVTVVVDREGWIAIRIEGTLVEEDIVAIESLL